MRYIGDVEITPQQLALAGIIAAGLAPLVTALSGWSERRLRREERKNSLLDERRRSAEDAYVEALAFSARLEQQISSQISRRHEETPGPLPTEDWLRLLARLHAYGSDTVRDAFAALADARSEFDRTSAEATAFQEQAAALQKRLKDPVTITPPPLADLLEKMRVPGSPPPPTHVSGIPEGMERERVKAQANDAVIAWKDAGAEARRIATELPGQVMALRTAIRRELQL